MVRYIARYIRPKYGPVVGTDNVLIREYANDRNALRFMHKHLQAPHFTPGQYELRTFPSHYGPDRYVGTLYKLV